LGGEEKGEGGNLSVAQRSITFAKLNNRVSKRIILNERGREVYKKVKPILFLIFSLTNLTILVNIISLKGCSIPDTICRLFDFTVVSPFLKEREHHLSP